MELADLHIHTIYSDGTFTPEEVVRRAKSAGLKAISITDHDAVEGIEPAILAGKAVGVEVIPGVELSVTYQGKDIHLLGYFINYKDKRFLNYLDIFRTERLRRVEKMVGKLNQMGLAVKMESVLAKAGSGAIGRPHVAQVLVEEGYVTGYEEAFQKYLSNQGPASIEKYRVSPEEGIALIQSVGGVSVLAHPGVYNQDEMIQELANKGLDGIEVIQSEHLWEDTQRYQRIAQKYNLLESGGSDCHGERASGAAIGTRSIPYSFVEKLHALSVARGSKEE